MNDSSNNSDIKIFLPFKNLNNPFINELEPYIDGRFVFGHFEDYNPDYHIVHIHWPIAIFDWQKLDQAGLDQFQTTLEKWKAHSKIVYTRHDSIPHQKKMYSFLPVYEMIESQADAIVHLGGYSLKECKTDRLQTHVIIPHHLFQTYPNTVNKAQARDSLNIPIEAKIITVFGSIRNREELNFVFKFWKAMQLDQSYLLIARYPFFHWPRWPRIVKRVKEWMIKTQHRFQKRIRYNYDFIPDNDIQNYLNASDLVLIPRISTLNSGIVPLSQSFNRLAIGPDIGNIKQELLDSGNMHFPAGDSHAAANLAVDILRQNTSPNNTQYCHERHPKKIATQYNQLYKELLRSS